VVELGGMALRARRPLLPVPRRRSSQGNTLLSVARFQRKGVIFLSVSLVGSDFGVAEQGLPPDTRGRNRRFRRDTAAGPLLPVRCF
jgi:hypothetical protein